MQFPYWFDLAKHGFQLSKKYNVRMRNVSTVARICFKT